MNRIDHIDNAKAIGMMLITASHIWVTTEFSKSLLFQSWDAMLNSFYVPLFFMLSGVFEPLTVERARLKKRILHLSKIIVTFMITGFFTIGVIQHEWVYSNFIKGTLVWFLITLLWITILFPIIRQIKFSILIITLLACGGYYLALNNHSYMYIGQAALCIPFYAIGYHFKEWIKRDSFNISIFLISLLIWLICLLFFYRVPQNISLNMVSQNPFTFYSAAIFGSILVIESSKLIRNRVISWYGRNSLVPMLVQIPIIMIIAKFIIAENPVDYFTLSILVIGLSGSLIPLFCNNKYNIFR